VENGFDENGFSEMDILDIIRENWMLVIESKFREIYENGLNGS